MPSTGGRGPSLGQILVMLVMVPLGVLLARQVAWHAVLVTTGIIIVAAAFGITFFYPSRKGYEGLDEAFDDGRGTGLWWWLWAYGSMAVEGIGIGLLIVGAS